MFECLELAMLERRFPYLWVEPAFASFRSDPRFIALATR